MIEIRPATDADFKGIWRIFHTVVVSGDTYAFDPGTNEEQAFRIWMSPDLRTYVATSQGKIVGTYLLKPNQPGLGCHVANAAFMVDPVARGQGLGEAMGRHALEEAKRLGYRAMQFNFVVSMNERAIRLWKKLGFSIVGTLPEAFRHLSLGYVDAYVMFRSLADETDRSRSG
jgi:L-amino acid N-acyltransferase YncA